MSTVSRTYLVRSQEKQEQRPVLITGANSGIGLELARHYATLGKPLILLARNTERLMQAVDELTKLNPLYKDKPDLITTMSIDVADADAVDTLLTKVLQARGIPELLINAAGVVNVGRFIEMERDYFDANLRIDFEGTVNVCRAVAPLMADIGSGHIVNIASVAGYMGIYGYTGYSGAKFAVMGFTEALRFEMKPLGVDVSVVCPPDTKTPGLETERAARPAETEAIAGSIKALCPTLVANKIVKGINAKRYYIIIGATSKFYFRLKGLWPEIYFAIVDGEVRKAQKVKLPRKSVAHSNEHALSTFGHQQNSVLHDILAPSACLPEHLALNRGGLDTTFSCTGGAHPDQSLNERCANLIPRAAG